MNVGLDLLNLFQCIVKILDRNLRTRKAFRMH